MVERRPERDLRVQTPDLDRGACNRTLRLLYRYIKFPRSRFMADDNLADFLRPDHDDGGYAGDLSVTGGGGQG